VRRLTQWPDAALYAANMPLLRWNRKIDKVDATMDQIREQMEISNEISDAISNPVNMGIDVDDVSYAIYKLAARLLKLPFFAGGIEERVGRARARAAERSSDGC
jgi:hypothetical protein